MKLFTAITLISTLIFSSLSAHEGQWTSARPDGHANLSNGRSYACDGRMDGLLPLYEHGDGWDC